MAAPKTEVYSWRVSSGTKARLEEAARTRRRTVAQLLDEIVTERLSADFENEAEAERQRRLRVRAARFAGRIAGVEPQRSEQVGALVRARLARRQRRAR